MQNSTAIWTQGSIPQWDICPTQIYDYNSAILTNEIPRSRPQTSDLRPLYHGRILPTAQTPLYGFRDC